MGKVCTCCGLYRDISEFAWISIKRTPNGPRRDTRCRLCNNEKRLAWASKNYTYEIKRDKFLQKNYGITLEEHNKMISDQGNKCPICERELERTHLDHNHDTGKVRAILCSSCNRGLGYFFDNPEVLEAAAEYIRYHRN